MLLRCGVCGVDFVAGQTTRARCRRHGTVASCGLCRAAHASAEGSTTVLLECGLVMPNDAAVLDASRRHSMTSAAALLGCSRWYVFVVLKRLGLVKKQSCCATCGRVFKTSHSAEWK